MPQSDDSPDKEPSSLVSATLLILITLDMLCVYGMLRNPAAVGLMYENATANENGLFKSTILTCKTVFLNFKNLFLLVQFAYGHAKDYYEKCLSGPPNWNLDNDEISSVTHLLERNQPTPPNTSDIVQDVVQKYHKSWSGSFDKLLPVAPLSVFIALLFSVDWENICIEFGDHWLIAPYIEGAAYKRYDITGIPIIHQYGLTDLVFSNGAKFLNAYIQFMVSAFMFAYGFTAVNHVAKALKKNNVACKFYKILRDFLCACSLENPLAVKVKNKYFIFDFIYMAVTLIFVGLSASMIFKVFFASEVPQFLPFSTLDPKAAFAAMLQVSKNENNSSVPIPTNDGTNATLALSIAPYLLPAHTDCSSLFLNISRLETLWSMAKLTGLAAIENCAIPPVNKEILAAVMMAPTGKVEFLEQTRAYICSPPYDRSSPVMKELRRSSFTLSMPLPRFGVADRMFLQQHPKLKAEYENCTQSIPTGFTPSADPEAKTVTYDLSVNGLFFSAFYLGLISITEVDVYVPLYSVFFWTSGILSALHFVYKFSSKEEPACDKPIEKIEVFFAFIYRGLNRLVLPAHLISVVVGAIAFWVAESGFEPMLKFINLLFYGNLQNICSGLGLKLISINDNPDDLEISLSKLPLAVAIAIVVDIFTLTYTVIDATGRARRFRADPYLNEPSSPPALGQLLERGVGDGSGGSFGEARTVSSLAQAPSKEAARCLVM